MLRFCSHGLSRLELEARAEQVGGRVISLPATVCVCVYVCVHVCVHVCVCVCVCVLKLYAKHQIMISPCVSICVDRAKYLRLEAGDCGRQP